MTATEHRLSALRRSLDERGMLVGARGATGAEGAAGAAGADPVIARVTADSRQVRPGDLFVAVPGQRADGHDFAAAASAAGATALLSERPMPGIDLPQLVVHRARPALALAAAWCHDFPSRSLRVVGITGTDGKTTTSYLVRAVLEAAGLRTGMVGTIGVIVGGHSLGEPTRSTTPEAPELQAMLATMRDAGDRWAVIEATSHGLAQDRVAEIDFEVAVLTNVTLEHLELHGTAEAYRAAKRRLFDAGPRTAVINADDEHASAFVAAARAGGSRVITYGTDARADIVATDLRHDGHGLSFLARTPTSQTDVRLALAGRFNVFNALAALGVASAAGLDIEGAARALGTVASVPGRMQRIELGQPFSVVVDYAHTAAALTAVLDELAPVAGSATGSLIAVFGSAGDRDTQKRPEMGRVAGERCRLLILTDEDPRSEDRLAILRQIATGAVATGRREGIDLLLIPDRGAAIDAAMAAARPGDAVLLAGKGHETTIESDGRSLPWDEAAAARSALGRLGYGASGD